MQLKHSDSLNVLDLGIKVLNQFVEMSEDKFQIVKFSNEFAHFDIGIIWVCGEGALHCSSLSSALYRFHLEFFNTFKMTLMKERPYLVCQNYEADYCYECPSPPFPFLDPELEG